MLREQPHPTHLATFAEARLGNPQRQYVSCGEHHVKRNDSIWRFLAVMDSDLFRVQPSLETQVFKYQEKSRAKIRAKEVRTRSKVYYLKSSPKSQRWQLVMRHSPTTHQAAKGFSFIQMVGSWSCPVTEHSLSTLDIKTSQPTQGCGRAGKEKCPWAKMAYGLKSSTTRLSNCHSNSKLCFTRQLVMRHSPTTHQAAKGFSFIQMVGSWSCPVTEHSLSTLDIKTSHLTTPTIKQILNPLA